MEVYSVGQMLPSRAGFEVMLVEVKWWLKLRRRDQYIRACNEFIRQASRLYGEFHPVFSLLYDIFSAYHLGNGEHEDAVTFAKSSLVNILKLCGSAHEKTSECYYHLALCYIKANRSEEAVAHLKKSKSFFEEGARTNEVGYAVMCVKLGLLHLNQNEVAQAVEMTAKALKVLENCQERDQVSYEEEITECFEILARCFEIEGDRGKVQELSVACLPRLSNVTQSHNLEKMLKIYLYPLLSSLNCHKAELLINLLSTLTVDNSEENHKASCELIRERIQEDSLGPNLDGYLGRLISIEQHLTERQLLKQWVPFKEVYPRETVKDFLALFSELGVLLGDNFLVGALREAL
jgi:tetratricopeptide (TPR) repeat protein